MMGLWTLNGCTVIPNYNQRYIDLNKNGKAVRGILGSLSPPSLLTWVSSQCDALIKLGLNNDHKVMEPSVK